MLYNLFENRDFVSVFAVALLAEGVDRNIIIMYIRWQTVVALLAEGVDRNKFSDTTYPGATDVALLAEGVDRNYRSGKRLSSGKRVALLAEGVDRNMV